MAFWSKFKNKKETQDIPRTHEEPGMLFPSESSSSRAASINQAEPGFATMSQPEVTGGDAGWSTVDYRNPKYPQQSAANQDPDAARGFQTLNQNTYGAGSPQSQRAYASPEQPGSDTLPRDFPGEGNVRPAFSKKAAPAYSQPLPGFDKGKYSETDEQIANAEIQYKRDRRVRARRRFVGAVMLLVLLLVPLPFLFDKEPPPPTVTVPLRIPAEDTVDVAKIEVPGTPPDKAASAAAPAKPKAQAKETQKSQPKKTEKPAAASKPEAKTEASKPAAKEKAPAEAKPAPAKVASGSYVIQVVAISNEGKANQMQKEIVAGGLPCYTEKVAVKNGAVWRVRVGPFKTNQAAEEARAKLGLMGYSGKVQQVK